MPAIRLRAVLASARAAVSVYGHPPRAGFSRLLVLLKAAQRKGFCVNNQFQLIYRVETSPVTSTTSCRLDAAGAPAIERARLILWLISPQRADAARRWRKRLGFRRRPCTNITRALISGGMLDAGGARGAARSVRPLRPLALAARRGAFLVA